MKAKFSPLIFLASLGAAGTAIGSWAFLNFTVEHGKGLINLVQLTAAPISGFEKTLSQILTVNIAVFTLLHIVLSIVFFWQFFNWRSKHKKEYEKLMDDPLSNSVIMAPFLSLGMSLNIMFIAIPFFFEVLSKNMQQLMLPGFIIWTVLWVLLVITEIRVLKSEFVKDFDISKANFGWLLQPFALGMFSVSGLAIASISSNVPLAHTAAFMSLTIFVPGLFLLMVKLFTLFKNHFTHSMPEKEFYPSFMIVIPNITLYAISLVRFGHYLDHQFAAGLPTLYYTVVTLIPFAFMTWYAVFGLALIKDYLFDDFRKHYHLSQWGFVCPMVAYGVLGIQVYKYFVASQVLYFAVLLVMLIDAIFFLFMLRRHLKVLK